MTRLNEDFVSAALKLQHCCFYRGVKVSDMTRDELIASFITELKNAERLQLENSKMQMDMFNLKYPPLPKSGFFKSLLGLLS